MPTNKMWLFFVFNNNSGTLFPISGKPSVDKPQVYTNVIRLTQTT
jgi:hypothetical protein